MCYYVWYLLEHKHHISHGFVTFYGLHLHGTIKIAQCDDWSEILKKSVLCSGHLSIVCYLFFPFGYLFWGDRLYFIYFLPHQGMISSISLYEHLLYLSLVNFIARWFFLLLCTILFLVYLCPMLKVMSFEGVLQDYFS